MNIRIIDTLLDGENMSWCKPYFGDRVIMAENETEICGLQIDGEDVPLDLMGYRAEDIKRAAMIAAGDDYGDVYDGSDESEILRDTLRCGGCTECPWRSICDAVQEEFEIPEEAPRWESDDDRPYYSYEVTVDCCDEPIHIRAASAVGAIEAVAGAIGRNGLHHDYMVDADTRGIEYCEGWIGFAEQAACHASAHRAEED